MIPFIRVKEMGESIMGCYFPAWIIMQPFKTSEIKLYTTEGNTGDCKDKAI